MSFFDNERKKEEELVRVINLYESAISCAAAQDYKTAYENCIKAVEPGVAETQYNWGTVYYQGIGVAQDYEKAYQWFTKAAEQDYYSALTAIGYMYYFGQYVDQDYANAAKFFERAAQCSSVFDGRAARALGALYLYGDGVAENKERAYELFYEAAARGDKEAGVIYWEAVYHGVYRSQQALGTPGEYNHAVYQLKSFDHENSGEESQFYFIANRLLGLMHLHGKGVYQDYQKALTYLRRAADHGESEAQFWLAVMCYLGLGTEIDIGLADKLLQESADSDYDDAKAAISHKDDREAFLLDICAKEKHKE